MVHKDEKEEAEGVVKSKLEMALGRRDGAAEMACVHSLHASKHASSPTN